MSADEVQGGGAAGNQSQDLQFDHVDSGTSASNAGSPRITCAVCGKSVGTQYYHVNDKPVCESCRGVVMSAAATPRTTGPLVRGGIFGLGAAIAGAAIYYAVIATANLEIGLVAILIGYMVGYAVRKGAGGRGGRRFQIVAVVLTYWSVGLAYAPLAFKQATKGKGDDTASSLTDSARVTSLPDTTGAVAPAGDRDRPVAKADSSAISGRDTAIAIGGLFLLVFALPVMSVAGSMPMGLIGAFIIFIGLRQAWAMTAAPKLEISGPYKVGAGPAPATS
jgi:hypothetical protein